jgi:tetratricopeptide (TPR) repeat protein
MKAFLSHSSKDKGYVETVASLLKPGSYELDSQTFDAGAINSSAIIQALRRSNLFCLFLSSDSVNSSYVDFETLLGVEFIASGRITQFLAICLDDKSFEKASANVKLFNILRKSLEPESTARLIQGHLVSAAEQRSNASHPFLGREDEIKNLEGQVTDHRRPSSKALFISGNFGSGRRSIAQKFFENQYPKVSRNFPVINVEPFAGVEELYRRVLTALRPAMRAQELQTRVSSFAIASDDERLRQTAALINSLLAADEAALMLDKGGVLSDSGALSGELNGIVSKLDARPHPPLVVVAPRMVPKLLRRTEDDISYLSVTSLKQDASERLVAKLAKDKGITLSDKSLAELIFHGDGHPFNIYRMIDDVAERGVDPFLANPKEFIDWKHRQSSEYLKKINLNDREKAILGLLKQVPELDFESIVHSLGVDPAETSTDLLNLTHLHIVESNAGIFSVAPPLRVAAERDSRLKVADESIRLLAKSLNVRLEDGTASIQLVDAAVLSSLESGQALPAFAATFVLPSHHIWLAKRAYDDGDWKRCISAASEGLKGSDRLSTGAVVAGCRFMCLAAARLGDQETFESGIKKLEGRAKDDWAKSNIAFLKGFNWRFRGNLPEAESLFREAYRLSPGNLHAARELAEICLARDNLDEAELFSREAQSHGPTNPYLLDTLISVLVRKHGRSAKHVTEIAELFDVLEKVGEEQGRSFFTTRKAEFEHLWGNNKEAFRLVNLAIEKTPRIFEPRRLLAEIYLKDGNKAKAFEVIEFMKGIVTARDPGERRANYRLYLKTLANYYLSVDRWNDAKELFQDQSMFTTKERDKEIKSIEVAQAFSQERRR